MVGGRGRRGAGRGDRTGTVPPLPPLPGPVAPLTMMSAQLRNTSPVAGIREHVGNQLGGAQAVGQESGFLVVVMGHPEGLQEFPVTYDI